MKKILSATTIVTMAMFLSGCSTTRCWKRALDERLPAYGHRNWIVVADSAYPKQSAPGIETIFTDGKQLDVLAKVLEAIEDAPHVQAIVMVDEELATVSAKDAPGVDAYRKELDAMLKGKEVKRMPHEDIIGKLDEGAKLFNILLLKTDLTIPYTSVFLELDCGYWNAEKEARLRKALSAQQ
jgi:L-fucose mutarotase/ribose pyranase (RbsD/FucU family)